MLSSHAKLLGQRRGSNGSAGVGHYETPRIALKWRVERKRTRWRVERPSKSEREAMLYDDIACRRVVDPIDQDIGELERRALSERGSFRGAQGRQTEKGSARIFASQLRHTPRLLLRRSHVDD